MCASQQTGGRLDTTNILFLLFCSRFLLVEERKTETTARGQKSIIPLNFFYRLLLIWRERKSLTRVMKFLSTPFDLHILVLVSTVSL